MQVVHSRKTFTKSYYSTINQPTTAALVLSTTVDQVWKIAQVSGFSLHAADQGEGFASPQLRLGEVSSKVLLPREDAIRSDTSGDRERRRIALAVSITIRTPSLQKKAATPEDTSAATVVRPSHSNAAGLGKGFERLHKLGTATLVN